MGLSVVELSMAVEDQFGVSIPDEDYQGLKTVGHLYWWLCRRLGVPDASEIDDSLCMCPAAFVRVRNAIVQVQSIPRSSLKLHSRLESLIPRCSRQRQWPELAAISGLEWPALVLSRGMTRLRMVAWGCLAASLIAILTLATTQNALPLWLAGIAGIFAGATVLEWWLNRQRIELPSGLETIGDLARRLADDERLHLQGLVGDNVAKQHLEVWERLRGIVSDKLDVPIRDVHMHSRWIEDLGAD